MLRVGLVLAAFIAGLLTFSDAAAGDLRGVAVYPFAAKGGADGALAEGLTAVFTNELASAQCVRIVAEDIVRDLAKQQGLEQSCGTETCQIDLARQAKADYLVRGDLAKVGDTYVLATIVVELASKRTLQSPRVTGRETELLLSVARLGRTVADGFECESAHEAPPAVETGISRSVDASPVPELPVLRSRSQTSMLGDSSSPQSLSASPPLVYQRPMLANYVGGDIIVEDDFGGTRFVGVNNNREDAYQGGELVLDATHKDSGHAYGFYPNSLNAMTDFIIEYDMKWLWRDNTKRMNRMSVSLRSNGDYLKEDAYVVKFYQDNTHDFFAWVDGKREWIQENTTSIGMRVDNGDVNRVRIVVVGTNVDVYLNGNFIGGFTDERFDHGTIGFAVTQGCKVAIDNLVVRKATKRL